MEHVRLIIIDEISMVGSKMLNYINMRLQQIFHNEEIFGGITIITFGDLRQLPPVGGSYIFKTTKITTAYSDIVDDYLWSHFKYIDLNEIMRQKGDQQFAIALNNMANECMTDTDVKLFVSRYIGPEFDDDIIPRDAICLLRTNKAVDEFNRERLKLYMDDVTESIALDVCKGACTEKLKQKFLNEVKKLDISLCFGLQYNIPLHVGARYMLTLNINTTDGLVNGACGVLKKIERFTNNNNVESIIRLWVDFNDNNIGQNAIKEYLNECKKQNKKVKMNNNNNWVPIGRSCRNLKTKRGHSDI